MINRLWKPWFVYHPSQLLRRATALLRPACAGYQSLRTSWGVGIWADPTKTIGRAIERTGVYDLAVTESMLRLIDPGDTVVDAGANVGYMTLLAGVAAAASGTVLAFEPHPELFELVRRNVEGARRSHSFAATELHNVALGAEAGEARLALPAGFAENDGVATLVTGRPDDAGSIRVPVVTLDEALGRRSVSVLKIDVEGRELSVLTGAREALGDRRIRHVVFEDHQGPGSEVAEFLQEHGYRLFALGWSLTGLELRPSQGGSLAKSYEAPNYLATLEPADALGRCRRNGWRAFRRRRAA